MRTIIKIVLISMFLLWTTDYGLRTSAFAAVPHLLNYQGRLTDASNAPLNGSYSMTFRLYDAETAGNLLWEEVNPAVVIQKGIFNVLLGSVTALNLPFDKQYFVEIKVGTEVMTPRQRIASAAYAITAENAVPKGVVVMWSGLIANIPAGWALCDGNNSTPDLRDRFIIGARQDDSSLAKTNLTGSLTQKGGSITLTGVSGTHILTINEIPAHTHTYNFSSNLASGNNVDVYFSNDNGIRSYQRTTNSTGGGEGHTHPAEVPPYYALAFIMKL